MSNEAETLRSTFLPLDTLGGTRLFLKYDTTFKRPYSVETRWQVFCRVSTLTTAVARYEHIVDHGVV